MIIENYSDDLEFVTKAIRRCTTRYVHNDDCTKCVSKSNAVGVYDIVTSCDEEVEKMLVQEIAKKYPEDRFYCEEQSNKEITDERTWVIDPIDGTVNFSRGIPMFGTQLALLINKNPVLAVIYLPAFDEMYTATESDKARLNGGRIGPYEKRKLKECIISMSDFSRKSHYYRDMQAEIMTRMYNEVARFKILGASCCDFAMLASGKIDMHMRFVNNLWDYVPGLYISTMAGACYDEELLRKHKFLLMAYSKDTCEEFRKTVLKDIFADEVIATAETRNEDQSCRMKHIGRILTVIGTRVHAINMEAYCKGVGIKLPPGLKYEAFDEWIENYLNALTIENVISLMKNMNIRVTEDNNCEKGGVFIIHSSKDKSQVEAIAEGLTHIGIPGSMVYCSSIEKLGTDLGESFHRDVKGHIKSASVVICVLSKDTVESKYCLQEIGACLVLDKPILPILVEGATPDIMPGFLDSRKTCSYLNTEEAIRHFLMSVSERVNMKLDDRALSMGVKTVLLKMSKIW